MRRTLLALSLALALVSAGCGGTPPPSAQAKVDFIRKYDKLKDAQLARICPSLYPSDFLRRRKHYRFDEKDLKFTVTAEQRAAAKAAGCTGQGTKPSG